MIDVNATVASKSKEWRERESNPRGFDQRAWVQPATFNLTNKLRERPLRDILALKIKKDAQQRIG